MHFCQSSLADKIIILKSKIHYAQFFVLPGVSTFIGVQYFKDFGYDYKFLLILPVGWLVTFVLQYIIVKLIRNNKEIFLNKIGITFKNTETFFWNDIKGFYLCGKGSEIIVYLFTKFDFQIIYLKNLSISKVKLKVLINTFLRTYSSCKKPQRVRYINRSGL
ncbi:hypothetical protein CHRY9390_00383 [Chryseobacterium aquaeductus]|uniref:Uncharacterized protein n=2 Tax=Chryseobacterium aquaeductus TaxID=2675056 RepID=A0A9N8QQY4_9FLAO|nr:hypothetical protein CHRY9390_00383 [Chryseobacterium potabilaquae]CAD7798764.1 hypothetical protein CHRY9390_00383 [Chryseobacterium aquaeductus]